MNPDMCIHAMPHGDGGMISAFFMCSIWLLSACAAIVYIGAAVATTRRGCRKWPVYKTVLWMCGIFTAAMGAAGPFAHRAHADFTSHMAVHLLLGMLAPLLLTMASPLGRGGTRLARAFKTTGSRFRFECRYPRSFRPTFSSHKTGSHVRACRFWCRTDRPAQWAA